MLLIDEKLDAMTEVVNIGVGRAAASLSELIGDRIELHVPELRIESLVHADQEHERGVSVVQGFKGSVSGNALLVFPEESGRQLASLLAGGAPPEELQTYEVSGILSEVGNIVLNGVLGSMANVMDRSLDYEVPVFYVDRSLSDVIGGPGQASTDEQEVLVADASLKVHSRDISGKVLIAFEVGSIDSVLSSLQF